MGAIGCMWLGARRSGHALLRALAYPAMGVLLLTLVLAYSRGALAALALGLAAVVLHRAAAPARRRAADRRRARRRSGRRVGLLHGTRSAPKACRSRERSARGAPARRAGRRDARRARRSLGSRSASSRRAARPRCSRAGAPARRCWRLIALAVIAFAGALAHSHRGLTGSVSHAFDALTNPNAKPPPNTPGRLTAVASVRARYWKEALQIFDAHPGARRGRRRLRDGAPALPQRRRSKSGTRTASSCRRSPTSASSGLLLALALLLTWMAAAGRATHPFNRRWTSWRAWLELRSRRAPRLAALRERELTRYTPERIGMLSMLCVVVVFGVHSLIDWTWYVPGDACVALLCAGWLAGRGPLSAAPAAPAHAVERRRRDGARRRAADSRRRGGSGADRATLRLLLAGAAIVAALLAAWSQWQPQRSEDARQQADALLEANDPRAASAARDAAVARDPLSVEALFTLANVQQVAGQPALAQATLERAVRLQPSNPQTWLELGRYDLVAAGPRGRGEGAAGGDLPQPRVDRARSDRRRRARSDRNPQRLHPGAAGRARSAAAARSQKRERTARASSSRRAPGGPPALRTLICLEAEVAEQRGERVAAVEAQVVAARVEVLREGAPGERQRASASGPCAGVLSSRLPPERSTRRTSDSHAAVSATCSITSPAHTTSKLASGAPTAFAVDEPQRRARDGAPARGAAAPRRRRSPPPARPRARARPRSAPRRSPRRARADPARTCSSRKRLRSAKSAGSSPSGTACHRPSWYSREGIGGTG